MARPERNNVDYFPFYCEEGKKMFYLEETYGNDGFATFLKLLRELAKTDFHYLDLSKNTTMMFLSAKCKVSKEMLENIINDLVDLEKFDAVLWNENKIIWCQDFVDSIEDAYSKRKNKCITYKGLLLRLEGLRIRKPSKLPTKDPVNTQSKVEYSKLNKNKVDNEEKPVDEDLIETTEKIKQINVVYEKFVEEVKKGYHQQWSEATYMRLKIKKGSLTNLLIDFKNQLIIDCKAHTNTFKLKDHLNNWLNKQEQIGKLDKYKLKSSKSLSI